MKYNVEQLGDDLLDEIQDKAYDWDLAWDYFASDGRHVCVCGNNRAVDRSPDSKRDPPFVSQIQTVQKTEAVP